MKHGLDIFLIGRFLFYNKEVFSSYTNFMYFNAQSILVGIIYYILSIFSILFILYVSISLRKTLLGEKIALIGQYSMEIYVIHMLWIKFIVLIPNIVLHNDIYTYTYF